jgi:hypothetical protein
MPSSCSFYAIQIHIKIKIQETQRWHDTVCTYDTTRTRADKLNETMSGQRGVRAP